MPLNRRQIDIIQAQIAEVEEQGFGSVLIEIEKGHVRKVSQQATRLLPVEDYPTCVRCEANNCAGCKRREMGDGC